MNMFDSNEEYAVAAGNAVNTGVAARPTDDQDRVEISALTDREIAEETLTYLRLFTDLMTEAQKSPMLSLMMKSVPGMGRKQ